METLTDTIFLWRQGFGLDVINILSLGYPLSLKERQSFIIENINYGDR